MKIISAILLLYGLISIIYPQGIWKIKSIWRYEKEASVFVLRGIRVFGALILVFFLVTYLFVYRK